MGLTQNSDRFAGKRSYVESTFEAWGLECAVLVIDMGHRCGYVRVPEDHPWFGLAYWDAADGRRQPLAKKGFSMAMPDYEDPEHVDYGDRIDAKLEVHGGVTFDGDQPNEDCTKGWWFGFDCVHSGDARDPALMSEEHRKFTAEHGDWGDHDSTVKSQRYVESECRSLASQIVAAAAIHGSEDR